MTGQQETIDTPKEIITQFGIKSKTDKVRIDLIKFLEGLGLQNLIITGSYDLNKLERIFSVNLMKTGTKVIIINEECALEKKRRFRRESEQSQETKKTKIYYQIIDSCVKCNECIEILGCPAINANIHEKVGGEEKDLEYYIDETRCVPEICPGVCKSVCKNYSIKKTIINPK
jgi:TPP-dependent indolepyruvate ferredoxin oxidoreductase alpha subunit